MSGRPPKSAKAKKAIGNPGDRQNPPNIEPGVGPLAPPAWVAAIPSALEEWNIIVPERLRVGIHTQLDVNQCGRYCILMALFKQIIQDVNRDGVAETTKAGLVKTTAALKAFLDINDRIRALEIENGGTPKSRNFLHLDPAGDPAEAARDRKFFGQTEEEA